MPVVRTESSIPISEAATNGQVAQKDQSGDKEFAKLATNIARVLSAICQNNATNTSPVVEKLKPFQSQQVPPISIQGYMERILKYAFCSQECYIIAMVYMDRLLVASGGRLTKFNVHRFLITSIMLAAKGRDDKYFSNTYYSNIGGISIRELNKLELAFLQAIDFDLYVDPATYDRYLAEVRAFTVSKEDEKKK